MKFRTEFAIPKPGFSIDHLTPIFSLGSCFSVNMAERLQNLKFPVYTNPFGISYNILSIENQILRLYSEQVYEDSELFEFQDLYHSFDHHSSFSGIDKEKVVQNINHSLQESKRFLKNTQVVIITVGTSYYYSLKEVDYIVNNCHKVPQNAFEKKLLYLEEGVKSLNRTLELLREMSDEKLHFVLTLSPVLHLRDGVLENNRSKAIALETLWQVKEQHTDVYYFPSFEICTTELRDYRFYEEDMVHPTNQTQQYIWNRFADTFFSPETKELNQTIQALRKGVYHKSFFPESEENKKRIETLNTKINRLQNQHPYLNFTEEKTHLKA